MARYRKFLKWDHDRGVKRLVPVDRAVEHCRRLMAAGMTKTTIADAAGITHSSLQSLLGDRSDGRNNKSVRRTTEAAILAVKYKPGLAVLVDATGSTRRLRDLAVRGFTGLELAELSGLSDAALSAIRRGVRAHLEPGTRDAILRLHESLEGCSSSALEHSQSRSRRQAERMGWKPLAVFDDPDNPLDRPRIGRRVVQ